VFESGFVASQIVIQKLTQVNKTGRRKIASSRTAVSVLRNVLHPRRELTKVRLVVTGERSPERVVNNVTPCEKILSRNRSHCY